MYFRFVITENQDKMFRIQCLILLGLFSACKSVPAPSGMKPFQSYYSTSGNRSIIINDAGEFDICYSTRCLPVIEYNGKVVVEDQQIIFYSKDPKGLLSDSASKALSVSHYEAVEQGIIRNDSIYFKKEVFVRRRSGDFLR